MPPMRIFISHTLTDIDFAIRLREALKEAGADAWLDDSDLSAEQALHSRIKQEIRERPVFIFIVSNEANRSTSVQDEIDLVHSCHGLQPHRIVLNVLARDTDPSTMDPWIAQFLRIEERPWVAYPPHTAIQKTIAALRREVMLYYPKSPVDTGQALFKRYDELTASGPDPSLGDILLVDRDAAKPDKSPQGTVGYRLWCSGGDGSAAIYWSQRGGAQPVWGAIRTVYGGRGSRHGLPLTPEIEADKSFKDTNGKFQLFEGRWNYSEDVARRVRERLRERGITTDPEIISFGAAIYWSPKHGAHTTLGHIGEYFERQGGTNGPLGFSVTSSAQAAKSHRGTEGWYQVFEGGHVHWSEATGVVATVSGKIRDYYNSLGGSGSWLGFPMSEEAPATTSTYGTTGTFQRFEGEWDYPPDVIELLAGVRCGATLYSSKFGVYPTGWGIGTLYERMHGTDSVLGFPTSEESRIPGLPPESADRMQQFEGGTMYYRARDNLLVSVLNAVHDLLEKLGGVSGEMGFPLAPAEPVPNGKPGQCIQRFEGGIIAVEGT